MKRSLSKIIIIFCFIFTFLNTNINFVFADDIDSENESSINVSSNISNDLSLINSRAYVVIDRNSEKILVGKNENQKRKMASTTKIMTATIIIENCNLDETIEVSKRAANTGGSRVGLKLGDKITIKNLLYGLMLCSGNDAAVALAEYAGGSIEGFAELMNKKAKELGLNNTHFETPHGLDSNNHYTTAYELAILSNYALKNDTFSQIVGTKNYTIKINGYPKNISNTNELLGNLNGVYGIKTGFTNGANRCLVTACKRNNMDIICVVLGADTKNYRTKDSIKLIEYTFNNFESFNINNFVISEFNNWKDMNSNRIHINKGIYDTLKITYSGLKNEIIPIRKDLIDSLRVEISCPYTFEAPLEKSSQIGVINIYLENEIIDSVSIQIENEIKKKNIAYYITYFIKNYSNIITSIK